MPLTSLSQLTDLGGRFLQLADGYKPPRYFTKEALDFLAYSRLGGTSGPAGLWLQLLMCRAAYEPSLNRIADVAAALGCDQSGIIDGTGVGLVPAVAYYGLSSGLAVALGFAGTTEVSQWLSYLSLRDQVVVPDVEGRVFQALADIGELLWPKVRDFLAGWNASVAVLMSGHSLGGAMVEIMARKLWNLRNHTRAGGYTYASPRVGNGAFADWHLTWLDRVVLEGDPVTDLPPPVSARQAVSIAYVPTGNVLPTNYRHSNCQRHEISVNHPPESSLTGPRRENVVSLAEVNLALSLDGVSARHGSAAYEGALYPWIGKRFRDTNWFAALLALSADMKFATGY